MMLPFYLRWTSPRRTLSLYTPLVTSYQDPYCSTFAVLPLFLSAASSSTQLFACPLLLLSQHQSGASLLVSPILIDINQPSVNSHIRYTYSSALHWSASKASSLLTTMIGLFCHCTGHTLKPSIPNISSKRTKKRMKHTCTAHKPQLGCASYCRFIILSGREHLLV